MGAAPSNSQRVCARPARKFSSIDDTEMLLIFVADVLATADQTFQIITAITGAEGLRLAATERPDLVLLDYSLTDMTGDKVCRALLERRGDGAHPGADDVGPPERTGQDGGGL